VKCNKLLGFVKGGEFIDGLSDDQIMKRASTKVEILQSIYSCGSHWFAGSRSCCLPQPVSLILYRPYIRCTYCVHRMYYSNVYRRLWLLENSTSTPYLFVYNQRCIGVVQCFTFSFMEEPLK
jgi:hypothetical protein